MRKGTNGFYVTQGTLHHDALSYVERTADTELFHALERGEFCYVLDSRQMGKSSLMVRTVVRLRQQGLRVAVLDLTALGQNLSPEQWYEGLLSAMGVHLDLEDELDDFWREHERLGPLQRWMRAVREVVLPNLMRDACSVIRDPTSATSDTPDASRITHHASRLVIFIDEIDTVRSLPFSTDEFFAAIRECYNRRTGDAEFERLTFCLLGVATPSDLIQDVRMTPFNIGRRIELDDFREEEAASLRVGLELGTAETAGRPKEVAHRLLRRIFYWTGGHPYLTQRLCQAVAEDASVTDAAGVDRRCEELFLSARARERDDNVAFVRDRLLRSEGDLASLLDLYRQVRAGKRVPVDDTNPLVELLRLSGVARVTDGRSVTPSTGLRVRNRIYERVFDREWVTQHLPDAEARRQRAAYRRGLARATAAAGVVVAVVGTLALAALSQAHRAEESASKERIATQQMRGAQIKAVAALEGRTAALQERTTALHAKQAALKDREKALGAVRVQRDLALEAQHRERDQRLQAVKARGEAVAQGRRAVAAQQVAQERVVALHVATGNRLVDEEDLLGALPWLAETLCLEEGKGAREAVHRMRLAAVLQQCPRPLQVLPLNGIVGHAEFSPDGRRVVTTSGTPGQPGEARVWDAATGQPISRPIPGGNAHFSPDGRRVVTSGVPGPPGEARVWDATTGQPISRLMHGVGAEFSSDGRYVVTANRETAQVWDAATGEPTGTPPLKHNGLVVQAAFSADGRRIVTTSTDQTARVWDAASGQLIALLLPKHNALVRHAAFSPDGRRVVTANNDGTARVWEVASGQPITPPLKHNGMVVHAAFSPDGRWIVTASQDQTARVWDAASGRLLLTLPHHGRVEFAAFSADGRRVVTASRDGTARVWDAASGQPLTLPLKHYGMVWHAAFSADGRWIVTASSDQTARVWDAASGQPLIPPLGHNGSVRNAEFSRDGRYVATASWDNTARVWDAASGQPVGPPLKPGDLVNHVAFSPDGRRVVTASGVRSFSGEARGYPGEARVWNVATGRPITPPLKHSGAVVGASFSPDGRRVVTASDDHTARVWEAATGRILFTLQHQAAVLYAAFSPDGRRVVTGSMDQTARVWDAVTGQPSTSPLEHNGPVFYAAFSPDGRQIVTAGGRQPRVWDAATGRPITRRLMHYGFVYDAEFSADGRRVVTASQDQTARVWDAVTGRPITPPLKHNGIVGRAAFSADGRRVLTASDDGTARVWDAATGQPITPPFKHNSPVRHAAFSADGRRIVTASDDGTARVWDLPTDSRPAADLRRLAQWLAGYQIDAGGGPVALGPAAARREGQALRAKYPADFAVSPAQVLVWHEREAEDAEKAHAWAAALPHLDAVLAAQPAQAGLRTRRGTVHAELGHWEMAAADFGQAGEREPENAQFRYSQALAQLAGGDPSGYRRRCAAMLARFGRSEYLADSDAVVRACVVAPGGVADAAPLVALAERAASGDSSNPGSRSAVTTLGAALYRAGRLEAAVQRLTEAGAPSAEGDEATGWLFLVMAQARLGHVAAARQWWEKAAAWMAPALQQQPWENPLPWDQRLILQCLRREAEELIRKAAGR